jgi:hypothetical protein
VTAKHKLITVAREVLKFQGQFERLKPALENKKVELLTEDGEIYDTQQQLSDLANEDGVVVVVVVTIPRDDTDDEESDADEEEDELQEDLDFYDDELLPDDKDEEEPPNSIPRVHGDFEITVRRTSQIAWSMTVSHDTTVLDLKKLIAVPDNVPGARFKVAVPTNAQVQHKAKKEKHNPPHFEAFKFFLFFTGMPE